jgi:hypothetical protein
MLALTSPTIGGRSVGTVHSRTQATEFSSFNVSMKTCLQQLGASRVQSHRERMVGLSRFRHNQALSNLVLWSLVGQHTKAISLLSLNLRLVNKILISFVPYRATATRMKFPFNYFLGTPVCIMKFLSRRFWGGGGYIWSGTGSTQPHEYNSGAT